MKFAIPAALSLVGLVASTTIPRQSCPEASRFGLLGVSPTTVNPGDEVTVTVDLNCAVNHFGIVPRYLDYTIEVPEASNNGHEPPILLARRDFTAGATSDVFTAKVPFASYFAGAPYVIVLRNTYPVQGTDGSSEVLITGGISTGLNINV
ncbi:hypothetical protein H0H87_008818 [Tephrocybe sp. NHM501043]|nr:hypothetical protein H0H87_008818 [Tephrocybe sp. NHM501043]